MYPAFKISNGSTKLKEIIVKKKHEWKFLQHFKKFVITNNHVCNQNRALILKTI